MPDQTNFGQAPQTAGSTDFNMHSFLIETMIGRICTMVPVIVKSVQAGGVSQESTVSVQPMVNQVDGGGQAEAHGEIFKVPVWRLQGGASAVIVDPVAGDIGIAVFAMRDISSVKANKAVANPGSARQYDWADAVYLGGILNAAPTQYIIMDATGVRLVDVNANQILMESAGVMINGVLIDRSGNLGAPGEITRGVGGGDSVTLGGHHHTQPNDSHGDVEQPTNAPTPGT